MKLFAHKGYRIANLPAPAKLVYTFFLVFIALGLWSSWDLYHARLADPAAIRARYVPEPQAPPPPEESGPTLDLGDAPAGGPAMDLEASAGDLGDDPSTASDAASPDLAPAEAIEDLKGPWVKDVLHQHLFSVSVVWLILAHLFMLTPFAAWIKGLLVAFSGLATLGHVMAPPLIWKTGSMLWLMPLSGAAMGLSWSLLVAVTLIAIWLPARR